MLYTVCLVLLIILAVNTFYFGIFSAAAFFFRPQKFDSSYAIQTLDVLAVFPVYKSDAVILDSVSRFQSQKYSGKFQTVVIADELQEITRMKLHFMGAWVITLPPSEERNKARALNTMLKSIKADFDICIILDADNVVENDFVEKMCRYFTSGALAVQARRVAKNSENRIAQLDTYSEIINNHIFRKGQRAIGFSASLIGSGMAFDYALFRNLMRGMDVYSGFDKELELRLLERRVGIEYAEDVVVYDEKIANAPAFVNQKRRWLYAQFYFFRKNFFKAIKKLVLQGNTDYANKVLQFILLPRILSIGLAGLLVLITPLVDAKLAVAAVSLAILQAISLAAPLCGIVTFRTALKAAAGIPMAFFNMLYALFTSGRAAGKFLHTPHN